MENNPSYLSKERSDIWKYLNISFFVENIDNWQRIDLKNNLDLKKIIEEEGKTEWIRIIETILSARLWLYGAKIEFNQDEIIIHNKYWVDSNNLEDWIGNILNDYFDENWSKEELKFKNNLIEWIKNIQDLIYTEDFIDFVFDEIIKNKDVDFLNVCFNNRQKKLENHNVFIFDKNVRLDRAISFINLAWKKIWKPDLFKDFKKASLWNIIKIAYKKWFLEKRIKIYNNSIIKDILKLIKDNNIVNINFLPDSKNILNDVDFLNSIDLTKQSTFDKLFHSAFVLKKRNSENFLENLIIQNNIKYKKDEVKYISLLSMYKTFYIPILEKINKWLENKYENIFTIEKLEEKIEILKDEIELLVLHKDVIDKDLENIEKTWTSIYNFKHKNKADDDILFKKNQILEIKKDILKYKNNLKKEIIDIQEYQKLKKFISIKNKLEISYKNKQNNMHQIKVA